MVTFPTYRNRLAAGLRSAEFGIDPTAQSVLEGVRKDLQRATISNSVKLPGSDTAYNQAGGRAFARAIGADSSGSLGRILTTGGVVGAATGSPAAATAASMGMKKASDFAASRVSGALSDLLMDPQKLAAALEQSQQIKPFEAKALARYLMGTATAPNFINTNRD